MAWTRAWYDKNRERILEERRKRYEEDPEYRDTLIENARLRRQRHKVAKVAAVRAKLMQQLQKKD